MLPVMWLMLPLHLITYLLLTSLILFLLLLFSLHTHLLHVILSSIILILTLYTTAGWYVCYFVRSSDFSPRSVGRSIRPVTFSFGILIFGRLTFGDRVTMSVCHHSAQEEKIEATMGKWGQTVLGGLYTRLAYGP